MIQVSAIRFSYIWLIFLSFVLMLGSCTPPELLAQPTSSLLNREKCSAFLDENLTHWQDCAAKLPDGSFIVDPVIVKQLQFKSNGLAALIIGGWTYMRPDGRALPVANWDNGPDDFSEGLVRTRLNGKTGFANGQLEIVIPAIYDFSHPFRNGRAKACMGCKLVSDGEHSWYSGGSNICIDKRGQDKPLAQCD